LLSGAVRTENVVQKVCVWSTFVSSLSNSVADYYFPDDKPEADLYIPPCPREFF